MNQLFSIAVHNAAVVVPLAVVVWCVSRLLKNPPAAHVLWLLVLVKLVTPPVVNFELWTWESEPVADSDVVPAEVRTVASQPIVEVPQAPTTMPAEIERVAIAPRPVADAVPTVPVRDEVRSASSSSPGVTIANAWEAVHPVLMWIWIGGAGLAAVVAGIRIVRFRRLLGGLVPAPERIRALADELSARLGLRKTPDVRVVNGETAPFVWGTGRRATVVLPLRLLGELDERQTSMVLAHELAHLRRRDHWVRIVELAASVLYWWHPVVWWVRRQLHADEEQCCDAWVAWVYPGGTRDYAECLLKASELLPHRAPRPAVLASPFLRAQTLKERIEVVLRNQSRRRMSGWAGAMVVLFAAAVIPAGIRGVVGGDEETGAKLPSSDGATGVPGAAGGKAIADRPLSEELRPFQGTWNFLGCDSVLWDAKLDEIRKMWRWEIHGREITWTRSGQKPVKLGFTADPNKTPHEINFMFLDGPDKGKKCQGIYEFERNLLWVCMTEPGAKVARPNKMAMSGDSQTALIDLIRANQPATTSTADAVGPKADAAPTGTKPSETSASSPPSGKMPKLLQGTFRVESWQSDRWSATPEEVQTWRWAMQGRAIEWTRPNQEAVRLAVSVDPKDAEGKIDFTFLNGPDKGKICRGIYLASRHEIVICFEDPGSNVGRPKWGVSKPGSHQTLLKLVPAGILPVADEVAALQGVWKFDIYYSDWWPGRILNLPVGWANWNWTVKGNDIHWTGLKNGDVKLSFTLDPSKLPRQIDLTFVDGPHKGTTLRGIYKFYAEDGCYICFADPGAKVDRPSRVEYGTGNGETMVSIQRVATEIPAGDAAPAEAKSKESEPDIDVAIGRLRTSGAFVREFYPRGDPQYWVQIISTGAGRETRESAENFDDAALKDVEVIGRGANVQLHLRNTSVTANGLKRLKTVGTIELLELTGSNVNDAMLKVLPSLPLRSVLGIHSNLVTNDGIQAVSECRDLTAVSLSGAALTDSCLGYLTGLPKLKAVSLGDNFTRGAFKVLSPLEGLTSLNVTAASPDLSDLKPFRKLKRLHLSGKKYGDEAAAAIAETFTSLEQVYLRGTSVTNAGVEHLSRLKTLTVLTLDRSQIDDGVAESIRKMKQLTWLSVEATSVGDETLAAACECPELRFLDFSETAITDRGMAHLVNLKKPATLYIYGCGDVTDSSVVTLAKMPDSQSLYLGLSFSGISEKGARLLRKALPHAQISWSPLPAPK